MKLAREAKRLPLGLIGMIGLVLLVEGFIGRNEISFRNPWGWDWHLADRAAGRQARECEVLFFGDSLMKFGVIPRVFEAQGGGKAYNFAVSAGQVPGSYFLFKKALDSGAKPRAVVLDTIPHLLVADLSSNAKIWPELLSPSDAVWLAVRARDRTFLAATLLAKAFPSVRDRLEIRDAVLAAFRGQPPPLRDGIGSFLRNWRVNRGAQVMKRGPGADCEKLDAWAPALFPDSWTPNPLNTEYLRDFFRLAKSRGIQVYWLLPPVGPGVQERREGNGRDADYLAYVRAIQKQHPEVVVLDARRAGYGDDVHIDPIHLDIRGAQSLSRDIARIVGRNAKSPTAWINLPRFHEPAPGGPIEDVEQSSIAIMQRKTIR